ncbi:MAG: energy transducer TonB [Spirochaetota bacterium]
MELQTVTMPPRTDLSSQNRWIRQAIIFLCWLSPFVELGVFFPVGVLLIYRKQHRLRSAAFESLLLQCFLFCIFYPIELLALFNDAWNSNLIEFSLTHYWNIKRFLYFVFAPLLLYSEYRYWRKKRNPSPFQEFSPNANFMSQPSKLFFILFLSILLAEWKFAYWLQGIVESVWTDGNTTSSYFGILTILMGLLSGTSFEDTLARHLSDSSYSYILKSYIGLPILKNGISDFLLIFLMNLYFFRRKGVLRFLRKPYCSLFVHMKYSAPTKDFMSIKFAHKYTYTKIRELLLPGWGHIYLSRYWIGFPLLFCFLLGIFFLGIAISYSLNIGFGVSFLSSFGLKSGIPEKLFVKIFSNTATLLGIIAFIVFIYFLANYHIESSMREDSENEGKRGPKPGFMKNFPLSLLIHLIILSVILIVPFTINRQQSSKKKKMMSNYQPEKLEYYFIDPEIPDKVEGLNGGVVSGIETIQKEKGEIITDEKNVDTGKVKGNVKRIKGKKLPKTYSNYISARMRGPEAFMEYWKRAPFPYSSVVAYTITADGDVVDVEIVEASQYPDQDELTVELIQNMSPLMPPPDSKGDIRVTELFWNGTIDPNKMPTQLQKDLVLQFDGRVMEEF